MSEALLVVMRQPCTACVILNTLNIETLERVASTHVGFSWKLVEIGDPRDIARVDGLEVEKFPAVILNGEQITAGSILPARRLIEILDASEQSQQERMGK